MQAKVWTKEDIQELLRVNDKAVARAITALYERQTAAEQADGETSVANGVGFNKIDAPFLTSIAKALPRYNGHMTERQLKVARKMLPKYWRQLVEIANTPKDQPVEQIVTPDVAAAQLEKVVNPNYGRF